MLEREAGICCAWAQNERSITRVYFFGSRVWGTPKIDSDLDIYIVATPSAFLDVDKWRSRLSKILQVESHVFTHFLASDELKENVLKNGEIVFSRFCGNSDFEFEDEEMEI